MSGDPEIGPKIRRLRRDRHMTQAALAKALGISSSYLNLIEHNRRNLTVPLLLSLAEIFELSLKDLVPDHKGFVLSDLMDALSDDLLVGHDLTNIEVRDLAQTHPNFAGAFLTLYDAYRKAAQDAQELAELGEGGDGEAGRRAIDGFPAEQVSDFFQARSNHFPTLEVAAERVAIDVRAGEESLFRGMASFLANAFGVEVSILPPRQGWDVIRRFDAERRELWVSHHIPRETRDFQVAHQIGRLAAEREIRDLEAEAALVGEPANGLLRSALANYFAGALLMPYDAFLGQAEAWKYDIDLLANYFETSFEQVCHRLTTLQRPNRRGIPFHLLRVDIAGNISKRFSLSGIRIPRHGGSCPRWNVYRAFIEPGRITAQISQTPDGQKYFSIARMTSKGIAGHKASRRLMSVGLGCRIEHAARLVYAQGMDLGNDGLAVPIGTSCRTCPRHDCDQRAFPSVHEPGGFSEHVRAPSPFRLPRPFDR